ncbi:MAG: ATP-binding protein [Dysgonamonadaceae bacterium]|jgi:hypothetical protein|nr:ATP-binding protein [Dysgonamonadaceae bacterium]MDD3901544.1 ATP-binding protein [Dysgonamonadaceae bacterium]
MKMQNMIDKLFQKDERGYLTKRESNSLEYKQNFQLGDNLLKYVKTLAGMANNKGGIILFGVQDSPHVPIGMSNNRFNETDPAKIDQCVREHFSQELKWSSKIYKENERQFGLLIVEENDVKPIICKKNANNILREGAIYYRYRGETKEIEYPELKKILDYEREKERILWIKHIEKISYIGPKNVHLLDSYTGELSVGNGKILLNEELLNKIKFIKEGNFTENDGEGYPTLKLIGDIDGIVNASIAVKPDIIYPLTTSDLQRRLNLNQFELQAIISKLDLKNKQKYHTAIRSGKNAQVHKYSETLIDILKRMLSNDNFLNECISEFKEKQAEIRKLRKSKRKK